MIFENINCYLPNINKINKFTLDINYVNIVFLRSRATIITRRGFNKYYGIFIILEKDSNPIGTIINLLEGDYKLRKLVSKKTIINSINCYCNNDNIYMEYFTEERIQQIYNVEYNILYEQKVYL